MTAAKANLLFLPGVVRSSCRRALEQMRSSPGHGRLLSGSMIMLAGTTLVSALNFAYNLVTAHLLGPTDFGHASVAVTLLMLASAITLSFQLVCAKIVAREPTPAGKLRVALVFRRRAWLLSVGISALLAGLTGVLTAYLRLPSRVVILLMALSIFFYIPLGARRGLLQGVCDFPRLAGNLMLESFVKLIAAVLLVELLLTSSRNSAMLGAVAAVTVSVIAAYYIARPGQTWRGIEPLSEAAVTIPAGFHEGLQASVFFVGQVLLNNIDIVLVKHFFAPREAGLYAAIALVGRVVYLACWSVVSAMFPIAAGEREHEPRSFLLVPLLLVAAIGGAFVTVSALFPHPIMHILFGAGFHSSTESLLGWYAACTALYALSMTLMTYEMSRKIANTAWLQLAFSFLVIAGIARFHSSMLQVIHVQIALRLLLLALVALPFLRFRPAQAAPAQEAA
jgi:O-antigen/teichoic acid export membrane protein